MTNREGRIKNMMEYFGWKAQDLADLTRNTLYHVHHQMSRGNKTEIEDLVRAFEKKTKNGTEYNACLSNGCLKGGSWEELISDINKC